MGTPRFTGFVGIQLPIRSFMRLPGASVAFHVLLLISWHEQSHWRLNRGLLPLTDHTFKPNTEMLGGAWALLLVAQVGFEPTTH